MEKIPVVVVGLGPVGRRTLEVLSAREGVVVSGAVDIDPTLAGQEVCGVRIAGNAATAYDASPGGVVVLTTASSLEAAADSILLAVRHGMPVVSSCEELSYPWRTRPELSARLDAAAREAGVAILGTGVNPGFLMDLLPVTLSGVCETITHVRVERFQDAGLRRIPFQKKIGYGIDPGRFAAEVGGHVGLTESMHLIGARLSLAIDRTTDEMLPVIGPDGLVLGIEQHGRAYVASLREVIHLHFRASVGEPEPVDRITLSGTPPMTISIAGGVHGDVATAAILANMVPVVLRARPGLRTMADIAPPSCSR